MSTERDMLDLLAERYTQRRRGTIADRWVRAEHVRGTQRLYSALRVADFIAIDKFTSTQAMHGHEVKVSRSDWLTELRDPEKAEPIKRFCHFWWLVVPDAEIVKDGELPKDWGLLVQTKAGLRAKAKAPHLDPDPLTLDFVAGLTAAVQRTACREPLHRDAQAVWLGNWVQSCGACGEPAPCPLHQPRRSLTQ
ncbi:hypothetical protein [Kocuria rosea]|uniref:hypothetical protein n=1 Tax=Kocuria rosea TaxID=1275 RepID=UPI003D34D04A